MRRPFTGSCHCKAIRFIVYLTVPAPIPKVDLSNVGPGHQRMYRCNCTLCHKAGMMHVRLPTPAEDFLLLSPLDPLNELGDYQCSFGKIHFLFCKTCGVRCFSFDGEGVVDEVDGPDGEKIKGWHAVQGSREGHGEGTMYLSVNAHAIDAGQEGLDMKEWTEHKKIWYLDLLRDSDGATPNFQTTSRGRMLLVGETCKCD